MSRTYRSVRAKGNQVYSVEEVTELYEISKNTVSNWIKNGLKPADEAIPRLFRGAELTRFHDDRDRPLNRTRPGEFKCFGCKIAVYPEVSTVSLSSTASHTLMGEATCPDCGGKMMKLLGDTECDYIRKCIETNTSLATKDEVDSADPAGIGKERPKSIELERSPNERVIHSWQKFAGRYDTKTIEAHLASIRHFERFIDLKPFQSVTSDDVAAWREKLLSDEGEKLSRSTIRHRASHLRSFFDWLSNQTGYRRLTNTIDYFALPRRFKELKPLRPREYPTLEIAADMLRSLPDGTLKQRRDRAIFAFAFVSGFRADALITLRIRHVDVTMRQVTHYGEEMRTKNGKSFVVNWFPRTKPFREVFEAWHSEVSTLGLQRDDALFPDVASLANASLHPRPIIEPMKTSGAVTAVFKLASRGQSTAYSPHAARHCLVHLGDQLCRTAEERKSWSLNMGHSSEAITWTHYGKVTDSRKFQIFENFEEDEPSTSEELQLMLDYHEHRLMPGSIEFERAEELIDSRRQQRRRRH